MAKNVTQYDLLISCPGDIQDELKIIEEVVDKFNAQFCDVLGISVRTKHWLKNSYPESGDTPQNLLNKQIVRDCDAAIAIFWTRFGTSTDKYGSGTEEEIEQMLEEGKQVFMYFSEKAQAPSITAAYHEDYIKIQAFKDKYKDRGIYWPYSSDEEFRQLFFAHLSLYFLSLKKIQEISQQKQSKISIKSISEKGFCDDICPLPFNVSSYLSSTDMMNSIKTLFKRISEYRVAKYIPFEQFDAFFYKSSLFDESLKNTIMLFAKKMNIDVNDGFFDLGGLRKKRTALSFDLSASLEGSTEEIGKHNHILELYNQIISLIAWMPFEKQFENYMCIKLAAVNEGTTFDEDIEITLQFNKKMIICHNDLPVAGESTLKYIVDECSLSDIFGIEETAQYNNYESSKKEHYLQPNTPLPSPLIHTRDYTEEYLDELDSLFIYKVFQEDEDIIVKLHIDYLKHKTAVAFPTVIFITNDIANIPYTITSKHSDKIVSGVLKPANLQSIE